MVDTGSSVSLHRLGHCVRAGHQAKASSGMELQLCRDLLLFPSPPLSRRGTPCNSPELGAFGSKSLGEAGQKITRYLKIPILPHQIRQREEDVARRGGRRSSGWRRRVRPSHTAHPYDPGTATVRETSSVSSLVIPMADTALEEALSGEQGESGGRHQTLKWTQPCMRQVVHREPKKWVSQISKQQTPDSNHTEQQKCRNIHLLD